MTQMHLTIAMPISADVLAKNRPGPASSSTKACTALLSHIAYINAKCSTGNVQTGLRLVMLHNLERMNNNNNNK